MKILYDGEIFSTQSVGGISRYFIELATALKEKEHVRIQIQRSRNVYYNDYARRNGLILSNTKLMQRLKRLVNPGVYRLIYLWLFRPDVLHLTYYDTELLKFKPKKTKIVVTVHDMIHELFPEQFSGCDTISEKKRKAVELADSVIAISNNTKNDLIKFFNVDSSKVVVIYHGGTFNFDDVKERVHTPFPQNYILFVGSRGGYKNFDFFIKSISQLVLDQQLRIVCAGGGAFSEKEQLLMSSLGISTLVAQHHLSDEALKEAYANAKCLVYPSLYEGFGLPILEAWAVGTPIILAKASCFPEIARDAALYFKPNDAEQLVSHVNNIVNDDHLRKEQIALGKERIKCFSITNMVEATLRVYGG